MKYEGGGGEVQGRGGEVHVRVIYRGLCRGMHLRHASDRTACRAS